MNLLIILATIHLFLFAWALLKIAQGKAEISLKRKQMVFSLMVVIVGPILTLCVYYVDKMKPRKPSNRYIGQSIDEDSDKIIEMQRID